MKPLLSGLVSVAATIYTNVIVPTPEKATPTKGLKESVSLSCWFLVVCCFTTASSRSS